MSRLDEMAEKLAWLQGTKPGLDGRRGVDAPIEEARALRAQLEPWAKTHYCTLTLTTGARPWEDGFAICHTPTGWGTLTVERTDG